MTAVLWRYGHTAVAQRSREPGSVALLLGLSHIPRSGGVGAWVTRAELEGLGTAELVELVQAGAETLSRDQLVHAAFAIINTYLMLGTLNDCPLTVYLLPTPC